MTAGAGTADAQAGRAESGAANRRLTIVTSFWIAARAGLRSRAISYGLVTAGLIPIAAVAWWFGSAS
jgi:hypothetical protein